MYRPSSKWKPSEIWGVENVLEKFKIQNQKQIAFVGMGNKFEIWNIKNWEMRQTGGPLSAEILDVVLPESIKSMSF